MRGATTATLTLSLRVHIDIETPKSKLKNIGIGGFPNDIEIGGSGMTEKPRVTKFTSSLIAAG